MYTCTYAIYRYIPIYTYIWHMYMYATHAYLHMCHVYVRGVYSYMLCVPYVYMHAYIDIIIDYLLVF